ncbi:MAG: hypothetical protein L0Y37_07510 [Bacteroidales bacterium]|nr:hypothetical protein [Bacteroidales bacterium]
MKHYVSFMLVAAFVSLNLSSQELKTPEQFLGYSPGERFTLHHLIDGYFRHMAEASPNAEYIQYGVTWEGRPLGVCIISSPVNLANLENIRMSNLQRAGLAPGEPVADAVPIVWLAYNVHGSEPVGSEAAMKVLYTLVTESYPGADEWLKNLIIIIDPCQNPDGRDLFTTRYLRAQAFPPSSDPNAWEHNQGWPSARLNHYLFDLNRDWSWHVQQETKHRMKLYNSFMPHIHADFHEMGAGSSFFFAPGAEPWHEAITPWQKEYHTITGKTTAKLFDDANRLYFTKDNFDLFCPSFGDTWPLFNGAMGFTIEQGGGAQAGLTFNREGVDTLTLKQRIEGHYLSSIGMIAAANDNRERLLKEFGEFFRSATTNPTFKYKTIVIKGSNDAASLTSLKNLLESNQIRYSSPRVTGRKLTAYDYRSDREGNVTVEKNDLIISAFQPQGRLMQVLFEPDSKSSDSISYDLTAWALPYVYNIEAYAVEEKLAAAEAPAAETAAALPVDSMKPYAYAAPMTGFNELRFMAELYKSGLNVRYNIKPFVTEGKTFGRGSVIVASGDNMKAVDFDRKVAEAASKSNITAVKLSSGLVTEGKDIGSDYAPVNKAPAVALAGGEGTSQAFGEIWYYMERELEFPVTVIEGADLPDSDLSDYDILVLPGGDYTKAKDRIMAFVKDGGRVVAIDNAMALFRSEKTTELGKATEAKETEDKKSVKSTVGDTTLLTRYEDQRRIAATDRSSGAIFRVRLDDTHPYAFGMGKEWFLMKRNTGFPFLEKGRNIGYITDNKPVAGFAGYKFCQKVRNTNVIASERIGEGEVIYISDDPYFRAYWKSGRVLLGNLILR